MKDRLNEKDFNEVIKLAEIIATLPEKEQEKLSYIVEGIRLANLRTA